MLSTKYDSTELRQSGSMSPELYSTAAKTALLIVGVFSAGHAALASALSFGLSQASFSLFIPLLFLRTAHVQFRTFASSDSGTFASLFNESFVGGRRRVAVPFAATKWYGGE